MAKRNPRAKRRAPAKRARRSVNTRKVNRPKKPSPIPRGMHTVTPSLVLKDSAAAIVFYEKALGAKVLMRMPGPDGNGVMHAEIRIGDSVLYLGDEYLGAPSFHAPTAENPATVAMWLYVKDCDASFERAVSAGAKVAMPLADMFWGDRYGLVTDPFGISWAFATHKRDVSEAEMKKAAAQMASQQPVA